MVDIPRAAVFDGEEDSWVFVDQATVQNTDPANVVYAETVEQLVAVLEELNPGVPGFSQFAPLRRGEGVCRADVPVLTGGMDALLEGVKKHGVECFTLLRHPSTGNNMFEGSLCVGSDIVFGNGLVMTHGHSGSMHAGYTYSVTLDEKCTRYKQAVARNKRRAARMEAREEKQKSGEPETSTIPPYLMHYICEPIRELLVAHPMYKLVSSNGYNKHSGLRGPYWDWAQQASLTIESLDVANKMGFMKKLRKDKDFKKALTDVKGYLPLLIDYSKPTRYRQLRRQLGKVLRVELRKATGITFRMPKKKPVG